MAKRTIFPNVREIMARGRWQGKYVYGIHFSGCKLHTQAWSMEAALALRTPHLTLRTFLPSTHSR